MTKVTVHQATFGINGSEGHSLIDTTIQRPFIKELQTDKIGTIKDTTDWEPYMKGYLTSDYYCFSKTYKDSSQRRGGAVFTHVLLIKKIELEKVENLASVFSCFKNKTVPLKKLQPIELDISRGSDEPVFEYKGEVRKVIHAFFNEQRIPVILLGQNKFEIFLTELWFSLLPELRSSLSFRYSVSDEDIPDGENKPTLVYSQENDLVRWEDFYKIKEGDKYELEYPVEKSVYLKGESACFSFLQEIGHKIKDFNRGDAINTAFSLYYRLEQLDIEDIFILIRKVGFLSSNKEDGKEVKRRIINILISKFSKISILKIRALRTLPLEAFEDGLTDVQKKMKFYLKEYLLKQNLSKEGSALLLKCHEEFRDDNQDWWINSIMEGFSDAILSKEQHIGRTIWSLWIFDNIFINWIDSIIKDEAHYEQILVNSFPTKISSKRLETFLNYTKDKSWFTLHAQLLLKIYMPLEALEKQLEVESGKSISLGLEMIITKVCQQDLLSFIIKRPEKRLLYYFAKLPNIGRFIDVSTSTLREVWLLRIEYNGDIWGGIPNPQELLFTLLDKAYFSKEEKASHTGFTELVELIGIKEPLSILGYSRRPNVWTYLKGGVKQGFLNATKEEWLEKLNKGNIVEGLEPLLEREIISSDEFKLVLSKTKTESTLLSLFENLHLLSNNLLFEYIKKWIKNSKKNLLNTVSLKRLGILLLERKHNLGKEHLLKYVRLKNNLSNAIQPFYHTLTLKQKLLIISRYNNSSPLSSDDWWSFVQKTFTDLYPNYSKIKTIWVNAGGKESQLLTSSTAERTWNELIEGFKKKRYNSKLFKRLLKEMKKEYDSNKDLKLIKKSTNKQLL